MAKSVNIRWTDKQKEIAALAGQGKAAKEIIQAGYTSSQVFWRYFKGQFQDYVDQWSEVRWAKLLGDLESR